MQSWGKKENYAAQGNVFENNLLGYTYLYTVCKSPQNIGKITRLWFSCHKMKCLKKIIFSWSLFLVSCKESWRDRGVSSTWEESDVQLQHLKHPLLSSQEVQHCFCSVSLVWGKLPRIDGFVVLRAGIFMSVSLGSHWRPVRWSVLWSFTVCLGWRMGVNGLCLSKLTKISSGWISSQDTIFQTACDSEKHFGSLVALTRWKVKDLNKNLCEGDQAQSISAERGKHRLKILCQGFPLSDKPEVVAPQTFFTVTKAIPLIQAKLLGFGFSPVLRWHSVDGSIAGATCLLGVYISTGSFVCGWW